MTLTYRGSSNIARRPALAALAMLLVSAACQPSPGSELPPAAQPSCSVSPSRSAEMPPSESLADSRARPSVAHLSESNSAAMADSRARPSVAHLSESNSAALAGSVAALTPDTPWRPDPDRYTWLKDPNAHYPAPVEALATRFPVPLGYVRAKRAPQSFGGWLAELPLAGIQVPVVAHSGAILSPATDRRIAAVVAMDVGASDLQQCADTVIRLHAEWAWAQGRRDQSYAAAAGLALPYSRAAGGERLVLDKQKLRWVPGGRSSSDHAGFRRYLNQVFEWANTVSLSRQARPVAPADLRAGDFFVAPGNPGHAIIVLDLARDERGQSIGLMGQGYMPAQSLQVLRGTQRGWFKLEPGEPVRTPFWRPFSWDSLRRLDNE